MTPISRDIATVCSTTRKNSERRKGTKFVSFRLIFFCSRLAKAVGGALLLLKA